MLPHPARSGRVRRVGPWERCSDRRRDIGDFPHVRGRQGHHSILGILLVGAEREAYGPFEVWEANVDLPFVKLSLGLSVLDESTAVFATSSSPDDVSAAAGVKAALDAAQGTDPGYLSDPGIAQLMEEVPPGFAMLVARNCDSLPLEGIEGCTGLAISATKEAEAGIIDGVIGFASEAMAQAALLAIQEQVASLGAPLDSPSAIEGSVDGSMVRFKVTLDINASILEKFGLGAQ